MELMDYHNHHWRCGHARGDIEDHIRAAIEAGLSEIGIAEHFPDAAATEDPKIIELPREQIGMPVAEFPGYIREIIALREKYREQIAVKIATEVAFVTDGVHFDRQRAVLDRFKDDLDYLLGGFHGLRFDGEPFVNFVWAKGRGVLDTYGEERIHTEYFKKMRSLIDTGYFDILAHFDNHRLLWRPDEPVYSKDIWCELLDLLDRAKSQGMAAEINTSGIRKGCRNQFPSDEIVKEMIQRNIPLVLSSDAHRPEEIGYGFAAFIEKAKPWGLTHLCSYEKRRQKLVPLE